MSEIKRKSRGVVLGNNGLPKKACKERYLTIPCLEDEVITHLLNTIPTELGKQKPNTHLVHHVWCLMYGNVEGYNYIFNSFHLAQKLGVAERSIRNSFIRLEEIGVIEQRPCTDKDGNGQAYYMNRNMRATHTMELVIEQGDIGEVEPVKKEKKPVVKDSEWYRANGYATYNGDIKDIIPLLESAGKKLDIVEFDEDGTMWFKTK